MPRKSFPTGGHLIVAMVTALGFGWLVVWITDHLATQLEKTVTRTLDAGNYATQATVESLIHLLIPDQAQATVDQPTDADWLAGQLAPDLDQPGDGEDPDPEDWVDVAESDLDPRLEPEIIIMPLDDRRVLTGLPVPGLHGEGY